MINNLPNSSMLMASRVTTEKQSVFPVQLFEKIIPSHLIASIHYTKAIGNNQSQIQFSSFKTNDAGMIYTECFMWLLFLQK